MARGNQLKRRWRLLQLIDCLAGLTVEGAPRTLGCLGWGTQAEVLRPIAIREALRQEAVAI